MIRALAKSIPGARQAVGIARNIIAAAKSRAHQSQARGKLVGATKLHLGAGFRQMDGWANLDLEGDNIIWDLTRPLPMANGSADVAYTEHFIEHITREDAVALLTQVRKVLRPGGVIRISTPDLAELVRCYAAGELVGVPTYGWVPTSLCRMVNEAMRSWDHIFLYDEAELREVLAEAGFGTVHRRKWRESPVAVLRDLESRPDMTDLILEATA